MATEGATALVLCSLSLVWFPGDYLGLLAGLGTAFGQRHSVVRGIHWTVESQQICQRTFCRSAVSHDVYNEQRASVAGQVCLRVGMAVRTLGDKGQEPSKTDQGSFYGLSSQAPGRLGSSGAR